jgi:Ion channel
VTSSEPDPTTHRQTLLERRARRIASTHFLTFGLALTFLLLALAGGVVIRLVDKHDFDSLGLAFWWALQTVTTVGYGDVVPTTDVGRVVGSLEMVLGISFVALLTAVVTSTVVRRAQSVAEEAESAQQARDIKRLVDALAEIRQAIAALDTRLDELDSGPSPG